MESEKKKYCSKYLKVVMAVLLAAALFYSGMKDYVKVGKTDTAVVELYGNYPTVNQAKQIWENYQSGDEITDIRSDQAAGSASNSAPPFSVDLQICMLLLKSTLFHILMAAKIPASKLHSLFSFYFLQIFRRYSFQIS